MSRDRLPNRRPAETHEIVWRDAAGNEYACLVGVGRFLSGRVGEVFATADAGGRLRPDSTMLALVSDACVLASHALQRGAEPAELAKSVLRMPAQGEAGDPFRRVAYPASPVGAVVDLLARLEVERQG